MSSVNGAPGRMPRVAIVGTGFVGSTTAYALLMSVTPAEIVLVDRDRRRAEGHAQDLSDAEAFTCSGRISVGDFCDCCSADVTIITTAVSQAGLKSRLDGLKETAPIVKGLVQDIAQHNPGGILLIASNPVDVLTYAAWKWSCLPARRVIGTGTALDTSRLRRRLAARYEIASDHVHAYVVGEHGDSQVPVLSSARVAGVSLDEVCRQLEIIDPENVLEKIVDETRIAGLEIIDAKGATYFGIGAVTERQKVIAEYWDLSQGPGTNFILWNQFAQFVAQRDHYKLDDQVKLFFVLNNAMFDTSIAAWDAKSYWDSERPVTAIATLARMFHGYVFHDDWQPYLPTPPFPDFVSSHSAISASAAEILKRFTRSDEFGFSYKRLAGVSGMEGKPGPEHDVVLSWATFTEAADESGMSRRYGGVHFEDADLEGRELGRRVAALAWNKAQWYISGIPRAKPVTNHVTKQSDIAGW